MFFNRNKKKRTPQEEAQRSQLGMVARLAGCGYLIYIIVKLLQATDAKPWFIAIGVLFLALSAFVIAMTVIEFVKNFKAGFYKETFYYDDEYREMLRRQQEEAEREEAEAAAAAAADEDDDGDYDEYDDEPAELPEAEDDSGDDTDDQ